MIVLEIIGFTVLGVVAAAIVAGVLLLVFNKAIEYAVGRGLNL
jgi:hypothetical protein